MRKFGAFLVEPDVYRKNEKNLKKEDLKDSIIKPNGNIEKNDRIIGLRIKEKNVVGYPTPSRKQEIFSQTMVDFGYPEHSTPGYRIKSHVHPDYLDKEKMSMFFYQIFVFPHTYTQDQQIQNGLQKLHIATQFGYILLMLENYF